MKIVTIVGLFLFLAGGSMMDGSLIPSIICLAGLGMVAMTHKEWRVE